MKSLASRQSAFGTAAQVWPRLRQVLDHLEPTWHLRSLDDLDAAFIERNAISGVIWDVDGTLTIHHADQLATEARAGFDAVRQLPALGHAILSNAGEARFRELGRIFPLIPICKGYRVDGELRLRTRLGEADSWDAAELEARLANGAVPVRKPDAELVRLVVEQMGLPSERVVMVGDQYLTDVAGANQAGVRSIKLPTIGRGDFPWAVRWAQRGEDLYYRLRYGRPAWERVTTAAD